MKVLYNVTVKVDSAVHQEWLEWMKKVHVPAVMATGCFDSYRITRIMEDPDEHGVGFAIQYVSPDADTFRKYHEVHAAALQKDHSDNFGGKYAAFRTAMYIEEEG